MTRDDNIELYRALCDRLVNQLLDGPADEQFISGLMCALAHSAVVFGLTFEESKRYYKERLDRKSEEIERKGMQ